MKTIHLIILICLIPLTVFAQSSAHTEKNVLTVLDLDKVLVTDPTSVSKKEFYEYSSIIIHGFSGSGGHFLGEEEIQWIRKAESSLKSKGIKLKKDEEYRNFAIADSYFNDCKYNKALEEFKNMNCQHEIELTEWFINNKGIKNGVVNIKEYPGPIPYEASETARVEDNLYAFIAYFKGPICRYNKVKNLHTIIHVPNWQYNWCDALNFENGKLTIKLRDITEAGDTFVFDNATQEIYKKKKGIQE
ncbi:MAG: hypothetical protein ABIH08_06815 [Candidatus Omnitrophota bacterium]